MLKLEAVVVSEALGDLQLQQQQQRGCYIVSDGRKVRFGPVNALKPLGVESLYMY